MGGPATGTALACVGSLARRELGPRSDVDLVLLHDGRDTAATDRLATSLWYPLWDSGVKLDHSVRTPAECADVAARELSAGVGLLDLRVVAGDAALVSGARTALIGAWRAGARKRLPELLASLDERLTRYGDAAYLLEPDLKEARGGFRDMAMLRALAATWLTDRPHSGVRGPYDQLLDVRDALHVSSGRTLDRLVAAEVDAVAERLGFPDPDDLHRGVSLAARRIGHAVDLTARSARAAVPQRRVLAFGRRERRPDYTEAEHGLIVHGGEVALGRTASPAAPATGLQAGALAASRGLVLSPVTAENLGHHALALPTPWPADAREALLQLLSSGPQLIPVWEALDLAGCISRWIPSWATISARPQHNPLHRHTVDRHSVQTVAEAQRHLTQVERPDLLLLACLFHDIGKIPGAGVDHAAVGAPIARAAVEAIGLPPADAELVELLVEHHLTLAALATKRDHADPATQAALVAAVRGRADVLDLLRYLTESDARAAGPAAWSPWRAQLINSLAEQVEGLLVADDSAEASRRVDIHRLVDVGLARSVALDGRPRVRVEPQPGGLQLLVAARDRLGLFSETAGLLASHGVQVRSAVLHTVDGVAVNTWRVDKQLTTDVPDPAFLVKQLERLEQGDTTVLAPVRRREARSLSADPVAEPWVELVEDASESAVVVEVRTQDRPGLLYALGEAVAQQRLSIRSAHASTLAGLAIDTFYLTEADGARPDAERARAALRGLGAAAGPGRPAAVAGC
ncbi:[protein-PII] uridylyltransferase [Friedmanniella luteola]|uniref:Bifunctional uridylyltransferase/uridylyl-removing enzyme n=1 Tax=Friedmanniella luteola TaxID=546871 RepID=A0A1H1XAL2_9ACTN|nr:[protein-PII] uridylyltransferase [Friedmanniella luteola]